jgi:hypothetical protein
MGTLIIRGGKRKSATVICNNCGKSFEKVVVEINRTEKKGGKHYCSRSCCGKGNIKNNLNTWYGVGGLSNLRSDNQRDEYTGLREFIRRARQRGKLGDLSLQDLKEQWARQNGICLYSGIPLKLPQTRKKQKVFEMASLDRINSSKPYEKGNIAFVAAPINYMKNSMTEEETIDFCKKIASYWKNK